MTKTDIETMLASYIETALWSSTDESGGKPLDDDYGPEDLLKATLREFRNDCKDFGKANEEHIAGDWHRAGHDFWLTRNGHGAGFWDGDWPEAAGEALTKASKAYGSVDLHVYRGKVRSS
jgi:hypothetical protein